MEDNKINGLELPLEFLDLPDDGALPLAGDAIEAVKPIVDLDTMESTPLAIDEVPIAASTPAQGGDVIVYGLNMEKRHKKGLDSQRRIPMALFSVLAAALVLLVIGVVMVPRILAAREPEPELVIVEEPAPVAEPEPEPEPETVEPSMGPNEIMDLMHTLKHKKVDVSVDLTQISLSIRDGFMVVTQTMPDDATFDAVEIVKLASLRSNALAAALTGKMVATNTGGEGTEFTVLTWIVRATDKKAYLTIYEVPGKIRTSKEAFGVLVGAQGYMLSDSVYEALGGTETGILAGAGTTPTNLDGKAIKVKAIVPKPAEEPEEPEVEAPAEEVSYVVEDYSYAEEDYSYEEYLDEDYSHDDTYVEDIEEVTTDTVGPEPEAYVVPDEPGEPGEPEEPSEPAGGKKTPADTPEN